MRVAIRGDGYASATEAFVTGNELAFRACDALTGRLAGCGGMAGDDAAAAEFAASYDEAATEAVAAMADLVGALSSLAHLVDVSLGNHARAEAASMLSGYAAQVVATPSSPLDRTFGIAVAAPPTSLGGDAASVPGVVNWLLDQLEGVFWPGADTDRLRDAGAAWRCAGESVSLLTAHCDSAAYALEDELSPEIPLAVATTRELRDRVDDLAGQLVALGAACEAYADQVDAKRAEMMDLLLDLAVEFGIGAVVAGGLSIVTGGAAGGAATGAAAARLAVAAKDLRRMLDALRVLTRGTAATLRPVVTGVRDTRAYLARLLRVRQARLDERGVIQLGREDAFKPGWLKPHEHSGSHTLLKHVGKSDRELQERLIREAGPPAASTFRSEREAERAIEQVLASKEGAIREWMAAGGHKRTFTADLDVGRILIRATGEIVNGTRVRLVLVRDPSMPQGWRLLTAFPDL